MQPNIIVVLMDQLRRDAIGFAGDSNVHTPVIDRLAKDGVSFCNAISTFPACVPFRFSLMTGEYAHSRNVPALGYRLSPAEFTLGEAMQAQGYNTAYIGKWHLYSAYGVSGGLNLSQACRTPIPQTHRRGWDHWRGFELRNDFYDTWYFCDNEPDARRLEGYQTDGLFDLALDYLEHSGPREQPFFLLLSVEAPHPPFTAPPSALERVRNRGPLVHRPNVDIRGIKFFPPEWYEALNPGGVIDPDDPLSLERVFDENMQAYYAMIEVIDANMARLETQLHQKELNNTIVVFLSDHGELGGSHAALGKAEPWEESIGIPLIVSSPATNLIPAGRTCTTPLHTEDLFATLVGLSGGVCAQPVAPRVNFAPYLMGYTAEPADRAVLLQFVTETRANRAYYDETWRGVRTQSFKYTVLGNRLGASPWQLFDLRNDPYEQHNLVAEPSARALGRDMHRRLKAVLDASEDDYALSAAFGFPARYTVTSTSARDSHPDESRFIDPL